jgi:rhodanese-related sulfurtransferase
MISGRALGLALALFFVPVLSLSAGDFPLRDKYPQVPPISTGELAQRYDEIIVVDVRSGIEFDVVHVDKAVHLPVAMGNFLQELEKNRSKEGTTPIAFYCNGTTCAKSYKAAATALAAGFGSVYVYDAGIFEWAKDHPEKTSLMGARPAPLERLISQEAFEQRKVPFAEFARLASDPQALVVDIREPYQRAKDPELPQNRMLALEKVRNIPSDRLVPLLRKGDFKDKRLLITDAVGKQVQWLQYYLEEAGYRNYHFLDQGVLGAAEAGGVL